MNIPRPKSNQPIPSSAKKVFEGIIFKVYQWEQEMFDGSKKTFEKLSRGDTVNVFPVTEDNKIVLTRQEQPGTEPFIGAIGGMVDPGEDIETAVRRELLEESGYEAGSVVLWDSKQLSSGIDWAMYSFVAKDLKKIAELQLDVGEKIELLYLSFDEFVETVAQENYRDLEISLKVLRAVRTCEGVDRLKKVFFS